MENRYFSPDPAQCKLAHDLYSQGISMPAMGIPCRDGGAVETDHRKIWRCASADRLAGLLVRQIIDDGDAEEMIYAMAYSLAKATYKL